MQINLAQKSRQLVKEMLARIGYRIERIPQAELDSFLTDHIGQEVVSRMGEIAAIDKGLQILLSLKYKELLYRNLPLPDWSLAKTSYVMY